MERAAKLYINYHEKSYSDKILIKRQYDNIFIVNVFHELYPDNSFQNEITFKENQIKVKEYVTRVLDLINNDNTTKSSVDFVIPMYPKFTFKTTELPKNLILDALDHFMKTF